MARICAISQLGPQMIKFEVSQRFQLTWYIEEIGEIGKEMIHKRGRSSRRFQRGLKKTERLVRGDGQDRWGRSFKTPSS